MKKVLLFSFSFDGHRQVYAQYFIELLLRQGYLVQVVSDRSEFQKDYPYLETLKLSASVKFSTIENSLKISLSNLRKLQDAIPADLTILLEADSHINILTHQLLPGNPRLRGKNVGIFIRSTNFPYLPKQSTSIFRILRFIKHFPITWDSNPIVFHEFALPKFRLLDTVLTVDEFFAKTHSKTHQWFPDLIFPLISSNPTIAKAEILRWGPQLACFLKRNRCKEVLFYFGTARWRRGYDTLLKLASEEKCCFIHCGLSNNTENYGENIAEMKNNLASQGLLFETNEYVQSYQAIQLFFESCKYVVLPYRDHFGSSGVMLQAVHFGRPVLVPDQGLMNLRAKLNHLGLTFKHDDYDDLKLQWGKIKEDSISYSDDLLEYKQKYSKENAQRVVSDILDKIVN